MLRQRAVDEVGGLLEQYGEFLPCHTNTGPLFAFRCLTLIDALAPSVELIPGKNGYVGLSAFAFQDDAIAEAGVFTLPQQPVSARVFYTESVVEAIRQSSLRMLDFTRP